MLPRSRRHFKRLRTEFGIDDVGIVLQSYLYRTLEDAEDAAEDSRAYGSVKRL